MLNELLPVLATITGEDIEALKEALVTTDEEGNERLNEGATELLLTKHAERVKGIRGNAKAELDRKVAKARQDAKTEFETEMQTLREELDALKAHPRPTEGETAAERLKREEETRKSIEAVKAEYETKLQSLEQSIRAEAVKNRAIKRAMEHFDSMRPIWPENAEVAQTRRQDFEALLRSYDYGEPVDNRFVLLKNGEVDEDDNANIRTLEKHVETLARPRFEFQKQEQKGNGGNQNGSGSPTLVGIPKSEAELKARMAETSDPAERVKIMDAYEAAQRTKN